MLLLPQATSIARITQDVLCLVGVVLHDDL